MDHQSLTGVFVLASMLHCLEDTTEILMHCWILVCVFCGFGRQTHA